MSWMISVHLRPVLATSVGFVVTPSRTPQEAASRISSMFAVSRKIFTIQPRRRSRTARAVKNVSCTRVEDCRASSQRPEALGGYETADREENDADPARDG